MMIERVTLDESMEKLSKTIYNEDMDLLDKDGNIIEAPKLNVDELDLLSSDCNTIIHISPLSLRVMPVANDKNIIQVFFLFKTKNSHYFIAQADYQFNNNPELVKLFKKSAYKNLTNEYVLGYILDSYKSKIVHIDMKFIDYNNDSGLFVLPCINENNEFKALFINKRILSQLSFFDNYFMYFNMNDRVLCNILKEFENDNIIDYKVTYVNGIEKVAKAGKHTVACVTSLECELNDSVQDIHILSSHDCGYRIKRNRTNCTIKDLNDNFGKSRREFIVDYISKVIINDEETLLIKAKNSYYGEVIFRFDEYQKTNFMKILEKKTNME